MLYWGGCLYWVVLGDERRQGPGSVVVLVIEWGCRGFG